MARQGRAGNGSVAMARAACGTQRSLPHATLGAEQLLPLPLGDTHSSSAASPPFMARHATGVHVGVGLVLLAVASERKRERLTRNVCRVL